jgi:hypothetical protein
VATAQVKVDEVRLQSNRSDNRQEVLERIWAALKADAKE